MDWKAEYDWIEDERTRFRALGRTLATDLPESRWQAGAYNERVQFLIDAFAVIRAEMELVVEIVLAIAISPDHDSARGYSEHRGVGVITIPAHDLKRASAAQIVAALAHESRHAWQFDVITGRIMTPLGAKQRKQFSEAEANYDPRNPGGPLEDDASDVAASVSEGYAPASI